MKDGPSRIIKSFFVLLLLNVGTFLMLKLALLYTALDDNVGFLKEKQAYVDIRIWKAAFYVHVFSSFFTLLAGFTQFSSDFLRKRRRLHKRLGKFYVWNILLINVPAGMIMAFYANGMIQSKTAFIILDILWFWFTLKGVLEVKRGNIQKHREFMMRSYALTLSAITLRTWKIILNGLTDLPPETIYMINAWLGFVPNLLFAEWLIRQKEVSEFIGQKIRRTPIRSQKEKR